MSAMSTRVLVACAAVGIMEKLAAVGIPPECFVAGPPAPPRPRLEPGKCICGRTISLNKPFCRACAEQIQAVQEKGRALKALRSEGGILAAELAAAITSQEVLDKVLQDAGERREEVLARIRPFLKFELAETGSPESGPGETPAPVAPSPAPEPESARERDGVCCGKADAA